MAEKKRKTCQICGCSFIPTSNVQKYCPACKKAVKSGKSLDKHVAYMQASRPGPVTKYTIETPEQKTQIPETPEDPIIPMNVKHGCSSLIKALDLPEGLAVIEEHAEILRRYYTGELVDKNELIAEIREKLKNFLEV